MASSLSVCNLHNRSQQPAHLLLPHLTLLLQAGPPSLSLGIGVYKEDSALT